MAKKLKQITKFMALCSLIILGACTQEKEFVNEHNHPKIDFKEKSFKEALSMPIFNDAYQKVAKRKSAFKSSDEARTALEEQFGFTIVEDSPIRIITDQNGTIFYTILIEREIKEELVFENLMIKVEDEETTAAIFKYTLTEKGTIIDNNNYVINGISSTEYTDLNIDSRVFYNAGGETCSIINVLLCDTADHRPAGHVATSSCWNGNGNTIYFGTALACVDNEQTSGGGANGDPGGPSSNNTGGVGASGGSSDPIVASPIPCKTGNCMEEVIVTPCEDLANHVDPAKGNVKPSVDWLKGILGNPLLNRFEFGTNFRKLADVNTGGYYYTCTNVGNFDNEAVQLTYTSANVGGAHNHPITGDSMFSFGDLDLLLDMYDTAGPNRKPEVVLMLVCLHPNPGLAALGVTSTYAVKVNDVEKLRAAINAKKNNPDYNGLSEKEKHNRINDELSLWYSRNPNKEKTFLQYFGNYGVDVYKANDNLSNWSKLTLQPNATGVLTVNQIPCI